MAPTFFSDAVISALLSRRATASVKLLELRQVVGDLEPRRLRADEDVPRRPNGGSVHERPHRDVHIGALPHHGEEEGATRRTPRVVQVFLSEDEERILAVRDLELLPLDPGKRLERRAGRRATARAMTVRRIQERVSDPITNRATPTLPDEHALARIAFGRQLRTHLLSFLLASQFMRLPGASELIGWYKEQAFL